MSDQFLVLKCLKQRLCENRDSTILKPVSKLKNLPQIPGSRFRKKPVVNHYGCADWANREVMRLPTLNFQCAECFIDVCNEVVTVKR